MQVLVRKILAVVPHPNSDNLNVVAVEGVIDGVVANKDEQGNPRWTEGEVCVYVPENAIVPQDVLEERGYWEPGAKKGMLGGSKGNRVKGRDIAGVFSAGLILKVEDDGQGNYTLRGADGTYDFVQLGADASTHLGITEYVPQ